MKREYHKWFSPSLGRDMELLVFGHAGLPAIVFPTSCGSFFEFEDRGMVDAVREKIEHGHLQLFCVDSVDAESWYNRAVPPRWRIARHMQYEKYIMDEVLPFLRGQNQNQQIAALGCSFGGYHAANIAFRHPDIFKAMLSISGAFDLVNFLGGFYDEDCYFNLPMHYLSNLTSDDLLDQLRHNTYILATGVHDQCWDANEQLARVLRDKSIPVRLDVWGDNAGHDWPWWQKIFAVYV
ncbi:alpha/beta hydrolase-fold protein [soil metagenome]